MTRQVGTTVLVVFLTALLCRMAWNWGSSASLLSHDDFRQTVVLTVAISLPLTALDRRRHA